MNNPLCLKSELVEFRHSNTSMTYFSTQIRQLNTAIFIVGWIYLLSAGFTFQYFKKVKRYERLHVRQSRLVALSIAGACVQICILPLAGMIGEDIFPCWLTLGFSLCVIPLLAGALVSKVLMFYVQVKLQKIAITTDYVGGKLRRGGGGGNVRGTGGGGGGGCGGGDEESNVSVAETIDADEAPASGGGGGGGAVSTGGVTGGGGEEYHSDKKRTVIDEVFYLAEMFRGTIYVIFSSLDDVGSEPQDKAKMVRALTFIRTFSFTIGLFILLFIPSFVAGGDTRLGLPGVQVLLRVQAGIGGNCLPRGSRHLDSARRLPSRREVVQVSGSLVSARAPPSGVPRCE